MQYKIWHIYRIIFIYTWQQFEILSSSIYLDIVPIKLNWFNAKFYQNLFAQMQLRDETKAISKMKVIDNINVTLWWW